MRKAFHFKYRNWILILRSQKRIIFIAFKKQCAKQFYFKHCNKILLLSIAHRNRCFSKIKNIIEKRIHLMILKITKIFYEFTNVYKKSKIFVMIAIRNFTLIRLIKTMKIIATRNVIKFFNNKNSKNCRNSQFRFKFDNCACY